MVELHLFNLSVDDCYMLTKPYTIGSTVSEFLTGNHVLANIHNDSKTLYEVYNGVLIGVVKLDTSGIPTHAVYSNKSIKIKELLNEISV